MWAEASTPQTTSFQGRLTEVRTPEVATRLQVRLDRAPNHAPVRIGHMQEGGQENA